MKNNEVSLNGDTSVNYETGEIMGVDCVSNFILPIDISAITSKEVFDEVIRERVYRRKYRLQVSPMLLDIVIEKQLSIPAISVLCLLGQKIGYNNMVYTSIRDIAEGSGYVRQTVSTAVSELKDSGFIKEPDNKLSERDSRFFLINPLYFFLGYYPNRDGLIKGWYTS